MANCCDTAADCNDGNVCTEDLCTGNACQHVPVSGCCLTAADCNDANTCTTDSCVGNVCANDAIAGCCTTAAQCEDGNVCTTDSCDAANDAALKLNGTSQYVNLGNDGATTAVNYLTNFGNGSFTIEGWFAIDNTVAPAQYTGILRQGRRGNESSGSHPGLQRRSGRFGGGR